MKNVDDNFQKRQRVGRAILVGVVLAFQFAAAEPVAESGQPLPSVDPVSVVRITYDNNLRIAAARYEMESAQYQFDRFERRLSQFTPLMLETTVERGSESRISDNVREAETGDRIETTVGFEKKFFDGKQIAAGVGARAFLEEDSEFGNPFFEAELEMPLFGSFTRLQRITERSFEESEMLEAWLDFIDRVNSSAENSQMRYFRILRTKNRLDLALMSMAELRALLSSDRASDRQEDVAQIESQIQEYQSAAVENQGELESQMIRLIDSLGLRSLSLDDIDFFDYYGEYYYGRHYLEADLESLVQEALESDIGIQILQIALENAALKKSLAMQGRWDIVGKLFGRFDFDRQGDDPSKRREYFVGMGVSVRRNDPKLRTITMKQSDAEIRRFSSEIEFRKREVTNLITRLIFEARNLRELARERAASRTSRLGIYEQRRAAYFIGSETAKNLLDASDNLYSTDRNLIETLDVFYDVIVKLDAASGFYFRELASQVSVRPGTP